VATRDETAQALLDSIHALAGGNVSESMSRVIGHLAEAYAWLMRPDQPHGGGVEQRGL